MPNIEIGVGADGLFVLNVAIAPRGRLEPERGFKAILDTGTQMTAISTRVVDEVRPDHIGETLMAVADSTERWTDVFWVRVRVPLGLTAAAEAPTYDIQASQMPAPLKECDVLLGMDIISQWHVTMSDGRCRIEF